MHLIKSENISLTSFRICVLISIFYFKYYFRKPEVIENFISSFSNTPFLAQPSVVFKPLPINETKTPIQSKTN